MEPVTPKSSHDFAISVWYHKQEVLTQASNKLVFRLSGQVLTGYKTNHNLYKINSSTLSVFLASQEDLSFPCCSNDLIGHSNGAFEGFWP